MIKKIIVVSLLTLSVFAQDTYTIDQLILKAMKNSPDLAISANQYKASKNRYDIATSSYLPKIDFSINTGQIGQSNIFASNSDMLDDTVINGSITLKQLLYDFGKTTGNSDSFKYDSDSFNSDNQQLISDKIRDVKRAYYGVLNSIALIDVNIENVKLNEIQLYRSKKYFDAGIRTKIDISDAKVESIKSKLDLRKSEYNLKLSYTALDKVVGFKQVNNNYKVFSKQLDLENLYQSIGSYPLTLQESIEFAYANRHEIKSFSAKIKSSMSKNKVAESEYYPELYFNANYTKQDADELDNFIPKDQWATMLNLNWNIYQGGASSYRNEEKRIQVNISKLQLENIKLNIKESVTQAYINVNKAKDSIELSQNLLEVSKEKFDQAQKRYEHGLSDYIELQQARQGYIDSMSSLVIDYYNYHVEIAYLNNAIGK